MKIRGISIFIWPRLLVGFAIHMAATGLLWVAWVLVTPDRKNDTFADYLNYML